MQRHIDFASSQTGIFECSLDGSPGTTPYGLAVGRHTVMSGRKA